MSIVVSIFAAKLEARLPDLDCNQTVFTGSRSVNLDRDRLVQALLLFLLFFLWCLSRQSLIVLPEENFLDHFLFFALFNHFVILLLNSTVQIFLHGFSNPPIHLHPLRGPL